MARLLGKSWVTEHNSVPARLGKGQGPKEIGHNLVSRERPKFGHNLVRKRTQNLLRVNDQNLILWAIDENMGTNLQAFYRHFYGCLKTQKQELHFVKIKNKLNLFFSMKFVFFNEICFFQ